VSLTVIVIAKNEALNIQACLDSVSFADQRLVLDSGSSDATVELALACGAQVAVNTDWQGFGVQKNRALALATGDWVLSIDADETVPDDLRAEILTAIAAESFNVYCFPRLSSYCGQFMRHSGWYPDPVTRLFKRGTADFSNDVVHEKLQTKAALGRLCAHLIHHSFNDFEAVLDKANRYSSAGAQALNARGKTSSPAQAVAHGAWAFFRTYVLRRGFLDGSMGLALALSNAEGTYYRYMKLWLLQRKNSEA
jgi:glycosyltransferase involved in cell wall biosynthesis